MWWGLNDHRGYYMLKKGIQGSTQMSLTRGCALEDFPYVRRHTHPCISLLSLFTDILIIQILQQGTKRMPGTAVTKSVVANEPGGRKREEIFVDIIEKISVTFSSSVSISVVYLMSLFRCFSRQQYLPYYLVIRR